MKRPHGRVRGSGAAAFALVGAFFLVVGSSSAAFATDTDYPLSWKTPSSQSVAYGDFWSFTVATTGTTDVVPATTPVTVTGAQSAYHPTATFFADGTDGDTRAYFTAPTDRAPLEAGNYTFTIATAKDSGGNHYTFETAAAAQLTITKAPIGIDLRVVTDPNSSGNAIVSARLTGSYIDNLYPAAGDPAAPLSPSGSWAITVKNPDGSIALQRTIAQTAGFASSLSFYWPSVPAAKTFTAQAVFTTDAASAGNFAISPSPQVSYTSSPLATPTPGPTEQSTSTHTDPNQKGFSLPLWLVIALAVLIVGLAITVTILAIRAPASPRPAQSGGAHR